MENIPLNTRGLQEDEIQMHLETYIELKRKYNATLEYNYSIDFKDFGLLSHYKNIELRDVLKLNRNNNESYIAFIIVHYDYLEIESHTCGISTLQRDFGHVIIKPNSFWDKIQQLISSSDVYFKEDKEFSDKFNIVTKNKSKALEAMSSSFRNAILNIESNDFLIEIVKDKLIIVNQKKVDVATAIHFAKFINDVSLIR